MAVGDFTKEEATEALDTLSELFKALSKPKQREYLGHLNDISLFIEAAKRVAPHRKEHKRRSASPWSSARK